MQHGLLHRKLVQVRIKKRRQAHRERHGVAETGGNLVGGGGPWSVPLSRGTKCVEIRTAIEFVGARKRLGKCADKTRCG